VRFFDGGAAVYYRVDGQLPTAGSQPAYARLTPDGELWVALLEKAFAQFRLGQNSYASIAQGWVQEPYRAIAAGSTKNYTPSSYTSDALAQALADELAAGHAMAAGSYSPSHATYITGNHAYNVRSVSLESGAWYVTVYNPYGNDGAAFDDNYWDGLLKLTIDQFRDAFQLVTACLA